MGGIRAPGGPKAGEESLRLSDPSHPAPSQTSLETQLCLQIPVFLMGEYDCSVCCVYWGKYICNFEIPLKKYPTANGLELSELTKSFGPGRQL